MSIERKTFSVLSCLIMTALVFQDCSPASGNKITRTPGTDTVPGIGAYFTAGTQSRKTPNAEGFIQRWLLLEPIKKPNRSNTVFTDSYIRTAFTNQYFPDQFSVIPRDGDKVKVGDEELAWHALDSRNFNVKLFRFA
jgi:hypothetical protein